MPKIPVAQTSFNRGELDPALYGRMDWQAYFSGAKRMQNVVCRTQGGGVKRGGTQMVAEALSATEPTRLIPFRFSAEQAYLLEFSGNRFRVLMNGGVLTYPDEAPYSQDGRAGREVVVESPFAAADLPRVRYAQREDVMVMTHPSYAPRILVRKSHYTWEFELFEMGVSVAAPAIVRLAKDGGNGAKYLVAAVTATNEESLPSDTVVCSIASGVGLNVPVYELLSIQQCHELWLSYGQTWPSQWDAWNMNAVQIHGGAAMSGLLPSLGYFNYYYNNGFVTIRRPNGGQVGYQATDANSWKNEAFYGMNQGWGNVLATMRGRIKDYVEAYNADKVASGHSTLGWDAVAGAARYVVYRSIQTDDGEKYYLVGETTATAFDDDNLAFAATQTPQISDAPFSGPGDYPGCCTFYQQRLILGRTDNKPMTFWGSQTGLFRNFNKGGSKDTDAFEYTLDADGVAEILWMKSLDDILMGTAAGEFRVSGGNGAISPTNVHATRQSNYGCSDLDPVIVGQAVVGAGAARRTIMSYRYTYADDAYRGFDISHYAGHLFEGAGRTIASVAYQSAPEAVLWLVMDDGSLASCTYVQDEEVLGWCRHATDGKFEALVNYQEVGGAEEIYCIATRVIQGGPRRYIERFRSMSTPNDPIADAWYVDCGLGHSGTPKAEFSGLGHLEGKTAVCLGDGDVFENLAVENGTVTLPKPVARAVIGLPYSAEIETMELDVMGQPPGISANARRGVTASILFYHSRDCRYGTHQQYAINFRTVADGFGKPIQPKTVRHTVVAPAPRGGNGAGILLASDHPVPWGVLSLAVTFTVGAATPRHGRQLRAGMPDS